MKLRRRLRRWSWWLVNLTPSGRGARRTAAWVMIIMALGRFGVYISRAVSTWLPPQEYGILLLVLGLLLMIDGHWRLHWAGRSVAVLGSLLLAGMAWDIGYISVTSLIEGTLAVILLREAFTSYDC
jgi:hypothetical protein